MSAEGAPIPSFLNAGDVIALKDFVGQEAAEGVFFGVECLLAMSAAYLLIRQGLRNSLPRCFLLTAVLLMLIDSTMLFAIHIMFDLAQIHALGDPTYNPLRTIFNWESAAVALSRFSYLLGDIIVVWRAWILFDRQIIFRLILVGCMMTSITLIIVDAYFSIKRNIEFDFASGTPVPPAILPAALLFSNLTATLLIGYKAWHYRQFFKTHLQETKRRTQAEKILILLVESGFLYCGLWIIGILWTAQKLSVTAGAYLGVIFPHAASLYPILIILLSALQKTYCDSTFQGQVISHPVEFKSKVPETQITQSIRFATGSSISGTVDQVSHASGLGNSSNDEFSPKPEVIQIV